MLKMIPEIEPYIRQQRANHDKENYPINYLESIKYDFDLLEPWLSFNNTILDIGGGVGALALFIAKYKQEKGEECNIVIVDGINDPPHRVYKNKKMYKKHLKLQ